MAFDNFKVALADVNSPQHNALLTYVMGLVNRSRDSMSKNFDTWDHNDDVFRSKRTVDREDADAKLKGKPTKMILPLTYSQIISFVAFNIMSITQNKRFFELEPTGSEDNPLAEPAELILERDIRRNQWNAFLVQFFLDIGRFSLGVGEVCYEEEVRWMRLAREKIQQGPFNTENKVSTFNYEPIPVFTGNRIHSVSPYRFLPDPSVALTKYQAGEFCGSEDVFTLSALQRLGDVLFNLDKIPQFNEQDYKTRKSRVRSNLGLYDDSKASASGGKAGFGTEGSKDSSTMVKSGPVSITKLVFDLTPGNLELQDKELEGLGDEKFPVRYLVWIANDKTIVRFEEAYFLHGMFPYFCAQYLPDQHQTINESLADICEQLTSIATWKINAHITANRSNIQGKTVVDPSAVETKSLEANSPFIYLKKGYGGTDVNRYIKQLDTQDPTANTFSDLGSIDGLLEKITGISAQMQGQYSQGRRSATQDRVVAQGAGARGKTLLGAVWDTAFEPLAKQLLANNRQEMDEETFVRILGTQATPDLWTLWKADPVTIATSEDFFVFDGTLPSEKAFLAQSLQEILLEVMANPLVAQIMGFGPDAMKALFEQIYLLRGVTPARLPVSQSVPATGQVPPITALPAPTAATSGAV